MEEIQLQSIKYVQKHPLVVPDLHSLVPILTAALEKNYAEVKVEVVQCPDLRTWGLVKPGLGSEQFSPVICDVGGVPNLLNPSGHSVAFSFADVAKAIGAENGYVIGACAGAAAFVGVNSECIPCQDCSTGKRTSHFAKISEAGYEVGPYEASCFGLLGNFYVSEGKTCDVLHIEAAKRTGGDNYITCIRNGLKGHPECGGGAKQIGMGGAFSVESGQVKAHIMPDFKSTKMVDGPQVQKWLRFFQMGPGLTCLTSFLTDDPTGGDMNYRLEHTHFVSRDGKQGGHYHTDTTAEEVRYSGYFLPAHMACRVNNAYKEIPKL